MTARSGSRAAQAVMSQVQAQEKEFNKGIDKFDQNLRTSTFDDSWLRTTGGGSSGSGGQLSSTDRTTRYGRNCATKAEVPAAPAAKRKGSTGRQQLDAAITLASAARLATAVLLDPDLLVAWFSSI